MKIEGFKLGVAKAIAQHSGISGKQAIELVTEALKVSRRNAFRMFSANELGPVKLTNKVFISGEKISFPVHSKIVFQEPSKAILQFKANAKDQEITFLGLSPDLLQMTGKYGYESYESDGGLVIHCGTLGGNSVPTRPPPPPPKKKP